MQSFARGFGVCGVGAAVWAAGVISAGAQSPPPAPTPTFDVQDSPLTGEELAKELGYNFYGNTWKFSEPTFVRVRVWASHGPVDKVPTSPPPDARWGDVFAPGKPQSQLTVHVLQKNDKESADEGKGDYTRIGVTLKINASGKDAPTEGPTQIATIAGQPVIARFWTGGGQGSAVHQSLVQGPHQSFNDEWRYANGSLGVMLENFGEAVADIAAHPGQPGQKEAAETKMRDGAEAGLRAAPLNLVYYKGEISGRNSHEEDKPSLYDVPRKRSVCVVTLECSREPFKAAPITAPIPTGDGP